MLKFKQIAISSYGAYATRLVGLTEDGQVYIYDWEKDGWFPVSMIPMKAKR